MKQMVKHKMKWILGGLALKVLLTAFLIGGLSNGIDGTIARRIGFNQSPEQSHSTGKTPATPGEQPWMVALVDSYESNAYNGQFCGGSLIAPDLVLTAAHCLEGFQSPEEIDVVVGRHVLSSSEGERIAASAVYMHNGYLNTADGEDNDIAIIKLERPSAAGTPIKVIDGSNAYVDDPGAAARATGWGILTDTGDDAPDTLHGVNLPVVSQETCRESYGSDLTPDGICAGLEAGGKDTCSGDSGGPLVATDRNGNPVQIGITSWGDICGAPGSYGVYARLTEYEGWINSIRNGETTPSDLADFEGYDDGDDSWFGDDEADGWFSNSNEEDGGWFFDDEDDSWDNDDEYSDEDWYADGEDDGWFFDDEDDSWFFDDEYSDDDWFFDDEGSDWFDDF
ncbi:MAG: serine protease [Chloroflexota bacterium]